MMRNHWHNAETSVWRFFVYLLQHHVKVLPLNLLSELARSALYNVFACSYIMCNVLCISWTRHYCTIFCHECVCQDNFIYCLFFFLFIVFQLGV